MRVALGRAWSSETAADIRSYSERLTTKDIVFVSGIPEGGPSQTLISQRSDIGNDKLFKMSDGGESEIV